MPGHRPQPMTAGDEYLALLLDELARQGEVLADIRDRLPSKEEEPVTAPTGGSEPEPVELREPEQPKKAAPARKTGPAKRGARRS